MTMAKISDVYRWIYGHITGKPTNFNWIIKGRLAGCGVPTSLRELRWLVEEQGIKSVVTIKEKPLPSEWIRSGGNSGNNHDDNIGTKIDYFHMSIDDYGAPSLRELDYVVNYIRRQIDNGKPVMVHCTAGKGRTGVILAAYLIKKDRDFSAKQAIKLLSKIKGESIQSKEQERIVFNYEKYMETEQENSNNGR
jgi:atypical dual specificity phosphatase